MLMNSIAESGSCIANMSNSLSEGVAQSERAKRMAHIQEAVAASKEQGHLPDATHVFVAPKNNTARGLDKVLSPQHLHEREIHFARSAAVALGLPASMGGPQISSGQTASPWQESPEVHGRTLLDACARLNQSLQRLLSDVYAHVYPSAETRPAFHIPVVLNVPYEHLVPLFDAQLLAPTAYSHIVEACTGFPLGPQALAAREDRHKAATVLPKAPSAQ